MTDAMYWSVTNESSMPWRLRRSKMCPRQGLSTMGTIGFGRLIVSGRRRLPSPPAITTACITASLGPKTARPTRVERKGLRGEQRLEVVLREGLEGDVRLRSRDASDLRESPSHDIGEIVVLFRTDH